jgi:hypothetical protein
MAAGAGTEASPSTPEGPQEVFELRYVPTVEFLRLSFRRWLWRAYGGYLFGMLVVGAAAVLLVRTYPWLSGFFTGAFLAVVANYRLSRRAAFRQLELVRGDAVELRLDAEGLTFRVPRVTSRVAWGQIRRVDRARGVWMIWLRDRSSPVFLPEQLFDVEAERYFLARLREHRVLVVD